MNRYKIAMLVHAHEELTDHRNFEPVYCHDHNHPRYPEARRLDDERCGACERRDPTRPYLTLILGGK